MHTYIQRVMQTAPVRRTVDTTGLYLILF